MKKEEIHLEDIMRILFGQAPPEFLLETFIRTAIIYFALLCTVRWLGKRMSGQLTIMEMAVMITIGAIVSVPMQVPDRGLLQGFLLLLCTLLFHRGFNSLGARFTKVDRLLQGKVAVLVKDGVLQLDEMKKSSISHQQIFSELRQENVISLGMVDRLYMEAEGLFSIYKTEEPRPGLPILPPDDTEIADRQSFALTPDSTQILACINCGQIKEIHSNNVCQTCGDDKFAKAIA
jgi:uncharacterized membrane protein YcaP (DUF421 family)